MMKRSQIKYICRGFFFLSEKTVIGKIYVNAINAIIDDGCEMYNMKHFVNRALSSAMCVAHTQPLTLT